MSKEKGKHRKNKKKNIIQIFFIIVFIISILCIVYYFYHLNKEKEQNTNILNEIPVDVTEVTETKTERMLQVEELQKQNNEIIGYIEIAGTNISYPVCQTNNNDYYLTNNYKKEKSSHGAIFMDKDVDLDKPSSNFLMYGHRNKSGLMFENLIKYSKEDFYKDHPIIRFTTTKEDATYEIISVFYSKVYYKSDTDVFRYYYFTNAENETEYNEYVENCKKASIYDIEETATYGEQLLTLSTCEYSQENGRFAVVAKKK